MAYYLLTTLYDVWYGICMNEIQERIASLEQKGWTLAALADELGITKNAVEKWKAGHRQPTNPKAIFALIDKIATYKRIPKKKRYTKGSRAIK